MLNFSEQHKCFISRILCVFSECLCKKENSISTAIDGKDYYLCDRYGKCTCKQGYYGDMCYSGRYL